jgi:glycosyltransferase involved in cell wall biosynthesis
MLGMKVGFEFDANNESCKELSDIIQEAMSSKLTRLGYRREMMKRARKFFSYNTFKSKYVNLYKKLKS